MSDKEFIKSLTYPLDLILSPVWIYDVDGHHILWANQAGLQLWDASSITELQSRDMSRGLSRKVSERLNQYCLDLMGRENPCTEYWTFFPHGRPCTCECSISAIVPPSGKRWLMVNTIRQGENLNTDTIYRNNALLHTSVCVSVYSIDGQLQYSNPSARSMLGKQKLDLQNRFIDQEVYCSVVDRLMRGGEVDIDAHVVTANGAGLHNLTLELCPDPVLGKSSILVSENDVSERHHAQQLVHKLAYYDALTQLPNRTSWFIELASRLREAARDNRDLAILFIDLDRFKMINDTYSHAIGDKLLAEVAGRLRGCLDNGDYLARLAGDEFTLLLEDDKRGLFSRRKALQVIQALEPSMLIDGHEISVSLSIGISQYPKHTGTPEQLMQQADFAMYVAKQEECGFRIFELAMKNQMYRRRVIEKDFMEAIESSALDVYYQPKICAFSGRTLGVEALLRWHHPVLGWVEPAEFVSIAEETGKIRAVTQYVLRNAMQQQVWWTVRGHDISVAVNVSPLEFKHAEFIPMIKHQLESSGCNPVKLELELTESVLMIDNDDIQATLAELSCMGLKISLDDFGSGYSNLSYLQKFPLNSIKIDRSFLDAGQISPVVDLIIGVGKELSLNVVVEGVETEYQRDYLVALKCHQLQGFLFAEPMNAELTTRFLNEQGRSCKAWTKPAQVSLA